MPPQVSPEAPRDLAETAGQAQGAFAKADLPPAGELLEGLLPPGTLAWNPLALILACAATAALGTALACARTARHRRGAPAPWPESARRNHPLALALALAPLALAAGALPIAFAFHGALAPWSPRTTGLACFAAGWLGAQLAAWPHARALRPELGFWRWQRDQLVGAALLKPAVAVVGAMLVACPAVLGSGSLATLVVGSAALTFAMSPAALAFWERLGVLRPAPPSLRDEVLARAAHRGTRVSGVWILDAAQANGFALFGPRALMLTEPLLQVLDDEQRATVLDHELAHLGEPRARQWLYLSRSFGFLPFGLLPAFVGSWGPWGGLIPPVLGLLFVALGSRTTRHLEERADEAAADSPEDQRTGRVYASALIELYRWNDAPAVVGARTGHPDLVDRVERAGMAWIGPRPEPPPRSALGDVLLPVGAALALFLIGGQWLWSQALDQRWSGPAGALACVRWTGGDAWALSELAIDARNEGRDEHALGFALAGWSLWRASEATDERSAQDAEHGWLAVALAGAVVGDGAEQDAWAARWLGVAEGVRPWVPEESADYYDADLGLLAADVGQGELARACLAAIEERSRAEWEASEDPWGLARLAALCAALGQTERSNGYLRQARAVARVDLDDAQRLEEFWGELAGRPGVRAGRPR